MQLSPFAQMILRDTKEIQPKLVKALLRSNELLPRLMELDKAAAPYYLALVGAGVDTHEALKLTAQNYRLGKPATDSVL